VTLLPRAAAGTSPARGFQVKAAGGSGESGRRGRRGDKGGRGAGVSCRSGAEAAFDSGGALSSGIGRAGPRRMAQAEEAQAPLLQTEEADAEWSSRPRRIALFVEPSPFASVHASSSQAFSCWSD